MHFYVSTYSIYLKEVEYPLPINRLPIIFKEGHHGSNTYSPPLLFSLQSLMSHSARNLIISLVSFSLRRHLPLTWDNWLCLESSDKILLFFMERERHCCGFNQLLYRLIVLHCITLYKKRWRNIKHYRFTFRPANAWGLITYLNDVIMSQSSSTIHYWCSFDRLQWIMILIGTYLIGTYINYMLHYYFYAY